MKVLNKLSKNCSIYGKKYEIYGPSNFWTFVKSNIFDDWNWNFWTLLGSEIGVKGPWAFWTPQWLRLCIYFIYLLEKANCFFLPYTYYPTKFVYVVVSNIFELVFHDNLRMICHNDFKCDRINFHKQKLLFMDASIHLTYQ